MLAPTGVLGRGGPARLIGAAALAFAAGCGAKTSQPQVVGSLPAPAKVARAAIEQLDSDGTGALSSAEWASSPALRATHAHFDADQDGAISQQEIQDRFDQYQSYSVVMMAIPCRVTLGGRALVDAEVTFEPEPFTGVGVKARGITADDGSVRLVTEGESVPGLYMGLYRIRVSKKNADGVETIPARYNTQTELGQEIALANRQLAGGILLRLESK